MSVDKTRPNPSKGDILIGRASHVGHLAVGEDYFGTVNAQIPDATRTGQYYITVWSDTYDAILEDTLASNINTDDPTQIDNNNYKARPIGVLGITPPDLTVTQVTGTPSTSAPGRINFSYSVQNIGDAFEGAWTDKIWLTDNPNPSLAQVFWLLGEIRQQRSLGNGESYSLSQTVELGPSVSGGYIVVQTDAALGSFNGRNEITEVSDENNI